MTPSNSGSKNGLVAWAVTATVLGLGGIIWGFVSFAQANKAEKDAQTLSTSYASVVDRQGLTGPTVQALQELERDSARGYTNMKLIDIAAQQKNELATLVGGTPDDRKATEAALAATEAAKAAAGTAAAIKTENLVATIASLTDYTNQLKATQQKLESDLVAANQATTNALKEKGDVMKAADEKVAAATAEAAESQKTADAYAITKDARVDEVSNQLIAKDKELVDQGTNNNERILELQQLVASKDSQLAELNARQAQYRVPTNQILSAADGIVIRTSGTNSVSINLGRGQQIAPGMTFEVYDKLGAPSVAKDDADQDKLLKGKASIEVVSTQPGISECRVVRLSPGATIVEGDPILNVVYDKNVKFNFFVFGKFNLDYRGDANDRDGEIVKRLISGWGANLADQIDTKTDFVVLGEEPVVPAYSQEELASEPEKAFQKEQAEQALDLYTEIRAKANELNIPILNQTRFLYMIGYYEEAGR